jgi:single-strand DNA-binding protein
MASVNKVILIGNCGRDPEVRYTPQGTAICNVSVATSSRRKDRNTGETVEDTQWHRVTFYERLAEIAGEYLKKGRPVYVEGRLKYGKYTDKDGIERNTVDIVAEQMQLLGGREGMGGDDMGGGGGMGMGGGSRGGYSRAPARGGDDMDGGSAAPAPRAAPQRPAPQRPAPAPQRPATGFDDMDDDIPF